jgi:hypothetical protein
MSGSSVFIFKLCFKLILYLLLHKLLVFAIKVGLFLLNVLFYGLIIQFMSFPTFWDDYCVYWAVCVVYYICLPSCLNCWLKVWHGMLKISLFYFNFWFYVFLLLPGNSASSYFAEAKPWTGLMQWSIGSY